jgi:uncharacterized membrane protein YesL
MRGIFSMDSGFSRYGGYLADFFILSVAWLVVSLVTFGLGIGVATAAMFYVSTRRISDREGYILADFWRGMKANFKRATIVWVVTLLVVLLLIYNIWLTFAHPEVLGQMAAFLLPAQLVLLFFVLCISTYLYPCLARFDVTAFGAFKSSFFMAIRHFPTTLGCVLLLVGLLAAGLYFAEIIWVMTPGIYALGASHMIMRVFRRYRPEIDPDPMVELAEIEAARKNKKVSEDTENADI